MNLDDARTSWGDAEVGLRIGLGGADSTVAPVLAVGDSAERFLNHQDGRSKRGNERTC